MPLPSSVMYPEFWLEHLTNVQQMSNVIVFYKLRTINFGTHAWLTSFLVLRVKWEERWAATTYRFNKTHEYTNKMRSLLCNRYTTWCSNRLLRYVIIIIKIHEKVNFNILFDNLTYYVQDICSIYICHFLNDTPANYLCVQFQMRNYMRLLQTDRVNWFDLFKLMKENNEWPPNFDSQHKVYYTFHVNYHIH